jgi:hypothetical protein
VNQRLTDFKALMKQKEDMYLSELEEEVKKS